GVGNRGKATTNNKQQTTNNEMNSFFCSEMSRQAGEGLIGSATPCQIYVLIECPFPWTSNAFESKSVPENLRNLVKLADRKASLVPIRFLLIHGQSRTKDGIKVLIYHQQPGDFCQGYQRREWQVDSIEEVAGLVKSYLAGEVPPSETSTSQIRDILICVHGSHDKCCAKHGIPFYREAIAAIAQWDLQEVRLWQTSHFGGHRFAPTLIDLPDGRYYGRLTQTGLHSILTRTGNLQSLDQFYRGWSILPTCLQVLEKELRLNYDWKWFGYNIAHRIIGCSLDRDWIQAEFSVQLPSGLIHRYEAEIVKDIQKILSLKGSCNASETSEYFQYIVKSLYRCSPKTVPLHSSVFHATA
ncbi:sucrase ferredoxin, partial [Limnofasciculus baicalensis]